MMDRLEKIYEITVKLKQLLEQEITSKNREAIIQQLNDLIAARGKWMEKIEAPYTNEEKALGEKIYALNIGIEREMQQLFSDLKLEMRQVQRQKKSKESYSNPYKHVQVADGTFLDRKN